MRDVSWDFWPIRGTVTFAVSPSPGPNIKWLLRSPCAACGWAELWFVSCTKWWTIVGDVEAKMNRKRAICLIAPKKTSNIWTLWGSCKVIHVNEGSVEYQSWSYTSNEFVRANNIFVWEMKQGDQQSFGLGHFRLLAETEWVYSCSFATKIAWKTIGGSDRRVFNKMIFTSVLTHCKLYNVLLWSDNANFAQEKYLLTGKFCYPAWMSSGPSDSDLEVQDSWTKVNNRGFIFLVLRQKT